MSYPFAAMLAYVWIDIVKPQTLAYSIINGVPIALISAVIVLLSYVIKSDRHKIRFTPVIYLLILFCVWITFTTFNANPGIEPWFKWDWVSKIVGFSIFITFVIRSRLHVEAFFLTMIFSVATISVSGGIKAALGGGGYGVLALMGNSNQGLAEGSTLAAVCVMLLPIMHYMYHHSIIFPNSPIFKTLLVATGAVNMISIVGTGARTGLVAGVFLILLYMLRSKHKWRMALALVVVLTVVAQLNLSGTAWGGRMSSIGTYDQDSSAKGRIAVWQWTAGFALQNPLGGGFDAYKLNKIASASDAGILYFEGPEFRGKAFHNIFFEVLGEQGIVGVTIYLAILGLTFLQLREIRRRTRGSVARLWLYDLATRLGDGLASLLVGGMFIGIAYQCYIFYTVAIVVCLGAIATKEAVAEAATGGLPDHPRGLAPLLTRSEHTHHD